MKAGRTEFMLWDPVQTLGFVPAVGVPPRGINLKWPLASVGVRGLFAGLDVCFPLLGGVWDGRQVCTLRGVQSLLVTLVDPAGDLIIGRHPLARFMLGFPAPGGKPVMWFQGRPADPEKSFFEVSTTVPGAYEVERVLPFWVRYY